MCNYITVTYENVNDYKGGYIWIASLHTTTYRLNWFLSQIALTTLKYETHGPMISTMQKNTDWFVESSHKNGMSITLNVTEYATFWMNKSKEGQYTWIKTQYGLVSVNIKPQIDNIWIRHVLRVSVETMRGLDNSRWPGSIIGPLFFFFFFILLLYNCLPNVLTQLFPNSPLDNKSLINHESVSRDWQC